MTSPIASCEVGGALEGVEQRGLVDLGVGLNQAATEFGEAGEFIAAALQATIYISNVFK